MRWTEENPDVRDVAEGELWAGIMDLPRPHVALVTRTDGKIRFHRFHPDEARAMGEELINFADQLNAVDN